MQDLEEEPIPDEGTASRAEILVATTWQCNLQCSYCFVEHRGLMSSIPAMSPELAVRVVDALDAGLNRADLICLHFYGGEPLCNLPAMKAMVRHVNASHMDRFRFVITTNGAGATQEGIDLLGEGGFDVILSIDGPPEIHDQCRRRKDGSATHADIVMFLEALKQQTSCRVRGSAVVRSGWRLAEATAYLRTLPVDTIKSQAVRHRGESDFSLTPSEREGYLEDLEGVGRQVIDDLEQETMPRDDRFSSRILQLLKGAARKSFCGAGTASFGITPDGTVLPCILMDTAEARLGTVLEEPNSWVAAGKRWAAQRPRRSECRECHALPLCGGGCPALMPFCGDSECEIIRKNCDVAEMIFRHFESRPETLLGLAGIW